MSRFVEPVIGRPTGDAMKLTHLFIMFYGYIYRFKDSNCPFAVCYIKREESGHFFFIAEIIILAVASSVSGWMEGSAFWYFLIKVYSTPDGYGLIMIMLVGETKLVVHVRYDIRH